MSEKGRPDWRALVAQAQPRRKSVVLCLRGDLIAERDEARDSGDKTRADELETEISDNTFTITLHGLPRDQFTALRSQCPDPDGVLQADTEKFVDELVYATAAAADQGVSRDDLERLRTVLTSGQWEEVRDAAWLACNEVDALPLPRRG